MTWTDFFGLAAIFSYGIALGLVVERHLGDQGAARAEAINRVMRMAEQLEALPAILAAAGLNAKKGKK